MGRGDKKSKKGKIRKGSFGVSRSKNAIKARIKRGVSSKKVVASVNADASEAAPKPKRTPRKKAE